MRHHVHEETKGHLAEVSSLFPPCGCQASNSKSSGSWQVPSSTELSGQPLGDAKEALP